MVHHEKPNTLVGLQKFIQAIDTQYWERKGELSHKTQASGSSGNKSEHKSGKGSSNSKQKNNHSGSTQGKGSTSEQKKSTTPDLSLKLGKDRKITPQECQRHLDTSFASFVAPLDTSPRTVQNPARLLPKPKHPSLIRTILHLPAQTRKKTEQSSRLCMTQGLH